MSNVRYYTIDWDHYLIIRTHLRIPHTSGTHMSIPHTSGTHMSIPHSSGTHMSIPHSSGTRMNIPHTSGTHMSIPHTSGTHMSIPHTSGTPSVCFGRGGRQIVSHDHRLEEGVEHGLPYDRGAQRRPKSQTLVRDQICVMYSPGERFKAQTICFSHLTTL